MFSVLCDTRETTRRVAEALACRLGARDLVVLSGEIGAGKTTFVQALAPAMGLTGDVTSPTFTLAHRYDGDVALNHLDLYRLERADELLDLDLPDMLAERTVTVIEWGERFLSALPPDYLRIHILFVQPDAGESSEARELRFEAVGESWASRVSDLEAAIQGAMP